MKTEPHLAAIIPQLGHYGIDPSRSAITISTRHLFGLAPARATLAIRTGTVHIAHPLEASAIYAEAETGSFHTSNAQRDGSVLSARFLDPSRYPVMTFTSARIDLERHVLAGILMARGVSRPVSFVAGEFARSAGEFTARATTRVDRTEFGITAARGLAARYLDITVEVTCVRS
jgi:polyisoprenoid-binding protein YceI